MDGNSDLARRVKAARALAGLNSVKALADAIGQGGLSTKTLRAIEQGKRHAEPRELAAIAEACGLPASFFRIDFSATPTRPNDLEERLASLEQKVDAARLEQLADDLATLRRYVEARGEGAGPQ